MFRKLIVAIGLLALCITVATAQETKEPGISSWFKELQKKLSQVTPKKSLSMSTGVAGVRGAKDDSNRSKLYWKGKKGEEPVTEDELKEFKEGVALVESGKTPAAIHEFEEFMKIYPDSALIPDAKKTLEMLYVAVKAEAAAAPKKDEMKAETKEAAKAEVKTEPQAETKAEQPAETKPETK